MKQILAIILAGLMLFTGTAAAYDASTPWTGTVRWSIPSDTSFTITFAGAETQIDFTATGQNQTLLEPDSQSATGSTPIITITNTGNTALTFRTNLTAAKPSWATIKVNDDNLSAGATEFDTTEVVVKAAVSAGNTASYYLWTNITQAPAGDTSRTGRISSATS